MTSFLFLLQSSQKRTWNWCAAWFILFEYLFHL